MANNKNKIKNHRAMKIMEGHKKENNVVKVINHRKGTKKKRNNSAWEKITKTFVVVTNIFNFYIYSFGCCYMLISVRSESGTGVTNECAM